MKNLLTNLFNSSFCCHAMRLAIVVVGLSFAIMVTAANGGKLTVYPEDCPTAHGKVYVSQSTSTHDPNWNYQACEGDVSTVKEKSDSQWTWYLYTMPDKGYYHAGWRKGDASEVVDGSSRESTIAWSCTLDINQSSPEYTYFAVFKPQYWYKHEGVFEKRESENDVYMGYVYMDHGEMVEADNIPDDQWKEGSHTPYLARVNANSAVFTYYAKPKEGNAFMYWVNEEGDVLSSEPTYPVTYQKYDENDNDVIPDSEWSPGEDHPLIIEPVYAVFSESKYYYHKRGVVDVANGEHGSVYVSESPMELNDVPWISSESSCEEQNPCLPFTSNEPDEEGSTTSDVIKKLNASSFSYYYYAKETNPLTKFVGWSYRPNDIQNIISTDMPHVYSSLTSSDATSLTDMPVLYAVFLSYYYAQPRVVAVGGGLVKIGNGTPSIEINDKTAIQQPANGESCPYSYTLKAIGGESGANDGLTFLGWSTTNSEKDIPNDNRFKQHELVITGNTSSIDRDAPHQLTYYAIFKSDIIIKHADRMLYYKENENEYINDANIIVEVAKAKKLRVYLDGQYAANFMLADETLSKTGQSITFDANRGIISLRLTYCGKKTSLREAVGEQVEVKFESYDDDPNDVKARNAEVVDVEKAPILTFLPTDGKGAYTVAHTDGNGVSYTLEKETQQSVSISITHESKSYISVDLTDNGEDDMKFFAWQRVENYGTVNEQISYLSYDEDFTYHFENVEDEIHIRAEFIPTSWAEYIIKSEPEVKYFDFQKAINVAELGSNDDEKIVVVDQDGLLPIGNYSIPSAVTILVPFDKNYACHDRELTVADFIPTTPNPKQYRKWTIENGTKIEVYGKICVNAKLGSSGANAPAALPTEYGIIELQDNVVIDMQGGSVLYAYGYITNPKQTKVSELNMMSVGRVVAHDQALIYEAFQFSDWRGGTTTANFILDVKKIPIVNSNPKKYSTFPINQYYVQNIEVPMEFQYGAQEDLIAGICVSGGSLTVAASTFISNGSGVGFMHLLDKNARLIKFYDAHTDRQKYYLYGNATLGNIKLSMDLDLGALIGLPIELPADFDSKEYVLPITSNIDIALRNANLTSPNRIAMLAGSTLAVDRNSKLFVNNELHVYDKDQNTYTHSDGTVTGYFSSTDKHIAQIKYTPHNGTTIKRTSVTDDAYIIADGLVDATKGYLTTTVSGAQIISNGGGKVWVGKAHSKSETYQYTQQKNEGYKPISITTTPMLSNGDSYTTTSAQKKYINCSGTWIEGTECTGGDGYQDPTPIDYTPYFTVAKPTIECYVSEGEKTKDLEVTLNNRKLTDEDWKNVQWEAEFTGRDRGLFTFNRTAVPSITLQETSVGTKTAVMILTATYTRDEIDYVYSQAVEVKANVHLQAENPLAFADLTQLFVGQDDATDLFVNSGNGQRIDLTVTDIEGTKVEDLASLGIRNNTIIPPKDKYSETLAPDTFYIIATQEANTNTHVGATTISSKMIISPRVVWNWAELYYPSTNYNPITMMDDSEGWTLEKIVVDYDVVNFRGNSPETYVAELFEFLVGNYEVKFHFKQPNHDDIIFTSKIYRDARYVRVDVNHEETFNIITQGEFNGVEYAEDDDYSIVSITSGAIQPNAWTIGFLGTPDKLSFIPTGDKAWQIEESPDGAMWTTTFPWSYLPEDDQFEHSLMPSTQYLRISYGAGGTGTMRNIYISKLEGVKFMPTKLYMPAKANESRDVAVAYVSDKAISIKPTEEFNVDPISLAPTSNEHPYRVENVRITTTDKCTMQKLTGVNVESSIGTEVIPIQTYEFPQKLPIVLASDMPAERFYYVTTHTYNTTWDEDTRIITMHNAVAKAQPFMVFHYDGAPTFISFKYSKGMLGEWKFEESTNGTNWNSLFNPTTKEDGNLIYIEQKVSSDSKYLRVTYNSLYAEKVEINDLQIIGEEGAAVDPTELLVKYISNRDNSNKFTVTAINLPKLHISTDNPNFTLTHGKAENAQNTPPAQEYTLQGGEGSIYNGILQDGELGNIYFKVYFNGEKAVDYTTITIKNVPAEGEAEVLATIQVTGVRETLTKDKFNLYTGVPKDYTLKGSFEGQGYRPLSIDNAFANDQALFDYLFIFGETTTMDGTTTINTPTTLVGSNAKTPCYVYKKNDTGEYVFYALVENANASNQITQDKDGKLSSILKLKKEDTPEDLKVYITGFCPYASTGYTKQDEGVFFFQGGAGDHVHVYLQDCYLYSRAKTENGHFFENRSDGNAFTEDYVRGSGAVLVFECLAKTNWSNGNGSPFNVTIHTRGNNMFKSHYGCFLESVAGRAFQASSPVQVHLKDREYELGSFTQLNLDDIWPNATTGENERTNGFLSLQKQVNNAPSIDLGNSNTVVNFNGGQVELENAQVVSDNYVSSMAIAHRTGTFAGFFLSVGLGTDGTGGTVHFKDGTTTVKKMYVEERFRQYYLMDEDGVNTSCLRCPAQTYVSGGSHCMMRACPKPTDKGGAPKSGPDGVELGLYKYPAEPDYEKDEQGNPTATIAHKGGWTVRTGWENINGAKLVVPNYVPEVPANYGIESITPNTNGTNTKSDDDYLNLWVTSDFDKSVVPEVNQQASFWKACMTEIAANYGAYDGAVGGDITIEFTQDNKQAEMISNLLYCIIDDEIHTVIQDNYSAPVKSPLPTGPDYINVPPSSVGEDTRHYISSARDYRIENKIYYIMPARADVWLQFTAPFDVEKVWIVEAYDEQALVNTARTKGLTAAKNAQARHNADFAAFFGVAMVIHPNKTFQTIYNEYINWAKSVDGLSTTRGKYELEHYYRYWDEEGNLQSNWDDASYFLYEDGGEWEYDASLFDGIGGFEANWQLVAPPTKDKPLMKKGKTYSMQFPYSTGNWQLNNEGKYERNFWDYWTGKFLIFESTDGSKNKDANGNVVGHILSKSEEFPVPTTLGTVYGNYTLDNVTLSGVETMEYVWKYLSDNNLEGFVPLSGEENVSLEPTESFLYVNVPQSFSGQMPRRVLRSGKIIYDTNGDNSGNQNGTSGGGHMPTVGGGNDLFITAIEGGINIAVAEPQMVKVMSSTGAILFAGYVTTATDVQLPTHGIYIVSGENEVQKIMH